MVEPELALLGVLLDGRGALTLDVGLKKKLFGAFLCFDSFCYDSPSQVHQTEYCADRNEQIYKADKMLLSGWHAAHRGHLHLGGGVLGDLADEVESAVLVVQRDIVPRTHRLPCSDMNA